MRNFVNIVVDVVLIVCRAGNSTALWRICSKR